MGWLQRIFGDEKPQAARIADIRDVNYQPTIDADDPKPPEKAGLQGNHDENGLAKRVALALDQDGQPDVPTLSIEQNGTTVVLNGQVSDSSVLSRIIAVAQGVEGATEVNADRVMMG
jgi:osmotically-inducible protein OsmY